MSHDLAEIAARGATFRLFTEVSFAEPPVTVPVFPRPGTYKHPSYGEIELTPERIANFVANFQNAIYQKHIPIDAEHESKLSGALGYLTGLVTNEDGSVDAAVEWTDRGSRLVSADRYKYVSPEWYDVWEQPDTEAEFSDVLVGLALTTRPFFKDSALRPLVAREGELIAPPTQEGEPMSEPDPTLVNPEPADAPPTPPAPVVDDPTPQEAAPMADEPITVPQAPETPPTPAATTEPAVALNEQTVQAFGEMRRKLEASEKLLADTQAALAVERREKRLKAFTDEVRGRNDQNDVPWIAGPAGLEGKVEMLMDLAEKFGEGSAHVRQYIDENRAAAAQQKQSNLFKELGTSRGSEGTSAYDRVASQATERARTSGKTFEQEFAAVLDSNASLKSEVARERRQERT
jgi:hypothetical protein